MTTKRYAIIENNVIIRVHDMEVVPTEEHIELKSTDNMWIGWVRNTASGSWSEGTLPQPVIPVLASDWWIDIGPFFDRFGAQKIPILASTDPVVRAIILDCTVRKYIDLQGRKSDIEAAMDILIAKGFNIDKASIVETLPSVAERHK